METTEIRREVLDFSFDYPELENLEDSLKFTDLKREITSIPRLSKEAKNFFTKSDLNYYTHLVKIAEHETNKTLQKKLSEIPGLGRKLKVTVSNLLAGYKSDKLIRY